MKPFPIDDQRAIRDEDGVSHGFRQPDWGTFAADGLRIHFPSRTVSVDGRPVALTPIEYRLLCLLVRNAGRVLSPQALLQQVWSADCSTTDVVRFQVSRLRAKLEAGWATPRYIFNKPGVGYWFRGPADGPGRAQDRRDGEKVRRLPGEELDALGLPWEQLLAAQQPAWVAAA